MNCFKTRVCVGVSVETKVIKLAVLGTKDLEALWPLDLRCFHDLESFEEYWHDRLWSRYGLERVGLAIYDSDDLGVLEWFGTHWTETDYFAVPTFTFHRQSQNHKVPGLYETAYDQALACLLHTHAKEFTSHILANARQLEKGIQETIHQLECLRAALSQGDPCPF